VRTATHEMQQATLYPQPITHHPAEKPPLGARRSY
jgi:hypothetical protein